MNATISLCLSSRSFYPSSMLLYLLTWEGRPRNQRHTPLSEAPRLISCTMNEALAISIRTALFRNIPPYFEFTSLAPKMTNADSLCPWAPATRPPSTNYLDSVSQASTTRPSEQSWRKKVKSGSRGRCVAISSVILKCTRDVHLRT